MKKIKEILYKDVTKYYIIISIISFIICTPLLIGFSQGQDMIYHISKTVGTEIAFKEGQILPLISSNFVNNFGYSWNIFYPPLANYIMIAIKLITHSYTQALNILIFLTVIISGIAMFNLVKKVTKSDKIALIASIIYLLAPYRLVDIYIRGALGEVMAFMFMPMVFHGLYNIVEEKGDKHYLLSIGAIGLLLSHNISTLLTIIACIIYIIINIRKIFNKEVIRYLAINVCFIISIVMFFYGPMLQNKMNTEFAVFNELKGSSEGLHDHSVFIYQLFFGKMQYQSSYSINEANAQNLDMCFAIGLPILIPILFTPFVYKKIDKNRRKLYIATLLTGLMFLILTTTIIPWTELPNFIGVIQYSFRFLLIATFLLSIVAAINLAKLSEKIEFKDIMIYTLIAMIYITPLLQEAQIIKGLDWKEFYNTETIEEDQRFSRFCATYEYLPSKAFNNMNYIANRTQDPILQEGNCTISDSNKNNLEVNFNVSDVTEETKIELPFIYYLGYTATINGEKIETTESNNGFVQIALTNGQEGNVEVKYTGTILYYISLGISITGTVTFIAYIAIFEYKKRKIKNKVREKNV